jgi:hypothetical protein
LFRYMTEPEIQRFPFFDLVPLLYSRDHSSPQSLPEQHETVGRWGKGPSPGIPASRFHRAKDQPLLKPESLFSHNGLSVYTLVLISAIPHGVAV